MRRARPIVAAAILSAALLPFSAHAQGAPPRTASLSWVRPPEAEECISTRALARAVDERLGRRVIVSASEADLSVEGSVERVADPPSYRAVVTLRDADGRSLGSREISSTGPGCDSLRAPLAVVIAVLIDPEATLSPPKPAAPASPPHPPPAPAPAPTASTPPRPCPPPPPDPWQASAWAGAVTGLGMLLSIGIGATAGARITPPRFWGIELYGAFWAPQRRAVDRGASVSFALAYGGIGLCPIALGGAGVAFSACLGARFGSLRATPSGFDVERPHEQLVADVTATGRLTIPFTRRFGVLVGLAVAAAIRRDDVRYEGPSGAEVSLFRPAPVSAAGDLAFGVRFP